MRSTDITEVIMGPVYIIVAEDEGACVVNRMRSENECERAPDTYSQLNASWRVFGILSLSVHRIKLAGVRARTSRNVRIYIVDDVTSVM